MNPYEESVTHRHQPRAEALIPMHNCYGGDYGYVPNYAAKYSRIYPDAQSQVNAELGKVFEDVLVFKPTSRTKNKNPTETTLFIRSSTLTNSS